MSLSFNSIDYYLFLYINLIFKSTLCESLIFLPKKDVRKNPNALMFKQKAGLIIVFACVTCKGLIT